MSNCRRVSIEDVRPLRHAVLRKGQDFSTTLYVEDTRADAQHFAAFKNDEIVGIASTYAETRADGPAQAWRLRGMASALSVRGKGFGSAVLRFLVDEARAEGVSEIWCNAREVAFAFYQAHGFELIGDFFDLPNIGPHKVMVLSLGSDEGQ